MPFYGKERERDGSEERDPCLLSGIPMGTSTLGAGPKGRETDLVDWRRPHVRTRSTAADTSMTRSAVTGFMMIE